MPERLLVAHLGNGARVCTQLRWLGVEFDAAANESADSLLSSAQSPVRVWVIPTDEELVITRGTIQVIEALRKSTAQAG